jgi:hypothetical protein
VLPGRLAGSAALHQLVRMCRASPQPLSVGVLRVGHIPCIPWLRLTRASAVAGASFGQCVMLLPV